MCCREGTDGDLGTAIIDCATDSEVSYTRIETVSYTTCQVRRDDYFINIMNKIKECLVPFSGKNRHPMLRRAVGPQLGGAAASASGESSRKLVANS